MCQEKMAKKALTVHKYSHISSSLRAAKSLFLLTGLLLFFHFSITESSYQLDMSYSCIMGVKEAKVRWQQLPSCTIFFCDMMKQSKWPARHQNVLAIPMSESK
jgi:hypothetical protein